MKNPLRLTVALAAGLLALPVFAARTMNDQPAAGRDVAAAAVKAKIASIRHEARNEAQPVRTKAQGTNSYPGTPLANEYRAYPPSCAAWPLPDKVKGPSWTARVPLFARSSTSSANGTETVTVTIWRIACSSSGALTPYNADNGFNAMTLLRIDRDAQYEGDNVIYPTFPSLQIKQGNINYGSVDSLVRAANEPNTYQSDGPFDAPIVYSTTYVLENYYNADVLHYYGNAFKLKIDPYIDTQGTGAIEFSIPDYSPTQSTYPDAYASLALDGYSAAQWYNTQYNEGLLVQITEQHQSNGSVVRQLVFDLLTEDTQGDPLWLIGNAAFTVGQTHLTVDTNYLGNGLSLHTYGTAEFEVIDCNHIDITFHPIANLPAPIPTITGTTTYDRLFTPNGMSCE